MQRKVVGHLSKPIILRNSAWVYHSWLLCCISLKLRTHQLITILETARKLEVPLEVLCFYKKLEEEIHLLSSNKYDGIY